MALKPLNSVAGFSVGETPANVIYANGDVTANNFSTTGTSNLNTIGNVHVFGGTSGQVIQTDGSGNLSFVSISSTSLSNGNSNIQVLANANITFSSTGNANIVVITGTGANVTGYLTVNGNAQFNNANLGNLATANYANITNDLVVQGNIANANNISVTNTITSNTANVTGNLTSGNANLGNLVTANYANLTNDLVVQGNIANANNISVTNNIGGNTANFSGNITSLNANLGNLVTANFANFANDVVVQGNIANANNISVTNTITSNTANVTGNLTTGNANLGNLATANNFSTNGSGGDVTLTGGNVTGANVVIANSFTSNGGVVDFATSNPNVKLGNVANVHIGGGTSGQVIQTDGSGNLSFVTVGTSGIANGTSSVSIPTVNGNIDLVSAGNTTVVVTGTGANITGYLTVNGNAQFNNANLGNLAIANFVNVSSNTTTNNLTVNLQLDGNTANFSGNITSLNANLGNLVTANYANLLNNLVVQGNIANANNISVTNSIAANSANITNDLVVQGNIANANNISVTNTITSNTANVIGNLTSGNANLGNLVTANYANLLNNLVVQGNIANANNISVTNNIRTGSANVTNDLDVGGNIVTGTGSGGNISGVNYITANVANITTVVNTGAIANGTSNIRLATNGNVTISSNNTSNVFTFSDLGANVIGYIQANGIISAGGFVGSNLVSNVGILSLSAEQGATAYNINLLAGGAGNIDVGATYITSVKNPLNPQDAATKEYVDNISQGLFVHPPANVLTSSNLTASYLNGGTVLSVTTITGGKTITFSTNHGLIANDDVEFTNSFNGIIAGEGYFVYSAPTLNSITVKDGYFGVEVTTLTNATGLTQPALGNAGVGATLTNSGANAALTIDSILMTVGKRVLVTGQTNQIENGIYDVTTVGTVSVPWVLTRSSDGDSYQPKSATALCNGSYFFISQGTTYAGSSYLLTAPIGEIRIGTSNIVFTQFSAAGAYTAGNGIYINGSIISANVDNTTTAIIGGNIAVANSAVLITPNIGAATGTSLNLTGNVLAANLNSNATITTVDLNATGNIVANNITSNTNANITGNLNANNANITNNISVGSANITLNLQGNTANFSGNLTSLNANLGNLATANFVNVSSNLQVSNLGITGNIVGNLIPNVSNTYTLGNATNMWKDLFLSGSTIYIGSQNITANGTSIAVSNDFGANNFFATNNVSANGNIYANSGGTAGYVYANFANVQSNLYVGANANIVSTLTAANIVDTNLANTQVVYANSSNTLVGTNNFVYDAANQVLKVGAGNTQIGGDSGYGYIQATTANIGNVVTIGSLTQITYGNVTTTSITANQTIASLNVTGITGAEFLVKATDAGGKYSVATVLAVTDGTTSDYSVFGTVQLGGYTGSLAVNIVGGNIRLQVTPASSNSTVWVTQARTI